MRHSSVDENGLPVPVEDVARRLTYSATVELKVEVHDAPHSVTGTIHRSILSIVQEAVLNSVRHGQASHIQIELRFESRFVQLLVKDDGLGFDHAALKAEKVSSAKTIGSNGLFRVDWNAVGIEMFRRHTPDVTLMDLRLPGMSGVETNRIEKGRLKMKEKLDGLKVAILVTDGFEQVELTEPRKALEDAGAETEIISPVEGEVKGWKRAEWGTSSPRTCCSEIPTRRTMAPFCCPAE